MSALGRMFPARSGSAALSGAQRMPSAGADQPMDYTLVDETTDDSTQRHRDATS